MEARMAMDRASSLQLLKEWTKSESLVRHALGVEAAMRAYAVKFGEDPELWGMTGLLHDLDYERFPTREDHPFRGAEELRAKGYPEQLVEAVLGHASYSGTPRNSLMAKTLFAVDELVGFLFACAYVQPDKSFGSVKVSSVKKKMKDKAFAKSVNRDEIVQGTGEMGIDPAEHIEFVRASLAAVEKELGFGTA
jgi:putative nucleotidyltransferase with HDIG domain